MPPLPIITHAFCRQEVEALLATLAADLAAELRLDNPDEEHDPSWITTARVNGHLFNLLSTWWDGPQALTGFPLEHSAIWSKAALR